MALPFILAGAGAGGILSALSESSRVNAQNKVVSNAQKRLRKSLIGNDELQGLLRDNERFYNTIAASVANKAGLGARSAINSQVAVAQAVAPVGAEQLRSSASINSNALSHNKSVYGQIGQMELGKESADLIGAGFQGAVQGAIAGYQVSDAINQLGSSVAPQAPSSETISGGIPDIVDDPRLEVGGPGGVAEAVATGNTIVKNKGAGPAPGITPKKSNMLEIGSNHQPLNITPKNSANIPRYLKRPMSTKSGSPFGEVSATQSNMDVAVETMGWEKPGWATRYVKDVAQSFVDDFGHPGMSMAKARPASISEIAEMSQTTPMPSHPINDPSKTMSAEATKDLKDFLGIDVPVTVIEALTLKGFIGGFSRTPYMMSKFAKFARGMSTISNKAPKFTNTVNKGLQELLKTANDPGKVKAVVEMINDASKAQKIVKYTGGGHYAFGQAGISVKAAELASKLNNATTIEEVNKILKMIKAFAGN